MEEDPNQKNEEVARPYWKEIKKRQEQTIRIGRNKIFENDAYEKVWWS